MAATSALLIVNRHSRSGEGDLSLAREVLTQRGITVIERQCDALGRDSRAPSDANAPMSIS